MMLKGHKPREYKRLSISMDSVEFKVELAQFAVRGNLKKKMVMHTPRSRIEE